MASLAQASTEFIHALRRGLEAYDTGDHARAYDEFSQALEIEPDNIWGLLWKGATAPSPKETVFWLEQALALEPDNEHAQAGLAWARSQLAEETDETAGDAVALLTDEVTAEEPEAEPLFQEVEFETLQPSEEEAGEESLSEDEDLPAWLQTVDLPSQEDDRPSWLRDQESSAEAVAEEEGQDWLQDREALAGDEIEAAPSWLRDVELPTPTTEEEEEDIPDWLRGEVTSGTGVDEEEVPDWLRDVQAPAFPTDDDEGIPDWLREPPTATAGEETPDWLAEEESASDEAAISGSFGTQTASSGLPDWLIGDETQLDTSRRAEGSLPGSSPAVEAYQAGLHAYEENRLDEAARLFERTVQLDSNHVEAHNYLGSVYFLQGRTDEAIRAFSEALRLDPNHAESHLNLGLVYQETNQPARAIQMFERYLELEPNSSIAGEVRGFIEKLRGS